MFAANAIAAPTAAGLSILASQASLLTTAGTSFVPTLPGAFASGKLAVVICKSVGGTGMTASSTWNTISSSAMQMAIFWKIATGTSDVLTLTLGASRKAAAIAYIIQGHHASAPVEGSIAVTNTINPASLTPSWGSVAALWLAIAGTTRTDNTLSLPTNYGSAVEGETTAASASDQEMRLKTGHRFLTASSEDPTAFGSTGTLSDQRSAIIAIRPL